jgi:hypothetical protein
MQVRVASRLQMVPKFQAHSYAITEPVVQTASEVERVRMPLSVLGCWFCLPISFGWTASTAQTRIIDL